MRGIDPQLSARRGWGTGEQWLGGTEGGDGGGTGTEGCSQNPPSSGSSHAEGLRLGLS